MPYCLLDRHQSQTHTKTTHRVSKNGRGEGMISTFSISKLRMSNGSTRESDRSWATRCSSALSEEVGRVAGLSSVADHRPARPWGRTKFFHNRSRRAKRPAFPRAPPLGSTWITRRFPSHRPNAAGLRSPPPDESARHRHTSARRDRLLTCAARAAHPEPPASPRNQRDVQGEAGHRHVFSRGARGSHAEPVVLAPTSCIPQLTRLATSASARSAVR